jgi:hypothetical protein
MLLVDEGVVLAALDILFKEIVHAGRRWGASGLSTVSPAGALASPVTGRCPAQPRRCGIAVVLTTVMWHCRG